MNITFPTGLKLSDWADQIVFDLDKYGNFNRIVNDEWQDWGSQFVGAVALGGYVLPSPYEFNNWQFWAEDFCGALL